MDLSMIDAAELSDASGVQVVLAQWVLKACLRIEEDLSPVPVLLVSVYPSGSSLGLDHEDAVFRDNHMVYLGGSEIDLEEDIVEKMVLPGIEAS